LQTNTFDDGGGISRYWTVSVALLVVERYVPRTAADVPCTALVVTVNVVLEAPAGMVADAGTWATEVLLLVRVTSAPVGGAAPFSVSVAVDWPLPVTVLGFKVTEVNAATVTVRVVVRVNPYTPVIVTDVEAATPLVVIVNVALLEPAGIVTFAGT
jgi:hypothetical protein